MDRQIDRLASNALPSIGVGVASLPVAKRSIIGRIRRCKARINVIIRHDVTNSASFENSSEEKLPRTVSIVETTFNSIGLVRQSKLPGEPML
jgi:hypothetical protein